MDKRKASVDYYTDIGLPPLQDEGELLQLQIQRLQGQGNVYC
jgi:hypothetical protein